MPPVPALEQSTVLVTGATDGLGRRVAHDLAAQGATVLVHGRSRERGEDTVRSIVEATGATGCRWCSPTSARSRRSATSRRRSATAPHGSTCWSTTPASARGAGGAQRELSADGHELRFAVNYLSRFLLTRLLLDVLRARHPRGSSTSPRSARAPIDFEDVDARARLRRLSRLRPEQARADHVHLRARRAPRGDRGHRKCASPGDADGHQDGVRELRRPSDPGSRTAPAPPSAW